MKYFFSIILFIGYVFVLSCKKESFITSKEALLTISADTVRFDTVFTSVGSITQSFKIFNTNNQKVKISSVKLMGGENSSYKIIVDGMAANEVNDLELEANDSVYVFVNVTIDPGAGNLPFIIQDSIRVSYNGNDRQVQLEAYGQNAKFIRAQLITINTTWTKELPYVIIGGVQVDTNVLLSIEPGTRIYLHADAPFIVDGTLQAQGSKTDSITFLGDRLDEVYNELPASWPGIYFRSNSKDNLLRYVIIRNAYQGIVVDQPSPNASPKLLLEECIIDNIYDVGIAGLATSIKARNCLITNCGTNLFLAKGGDYEFTHCTVASYSNIFILHKNPVLFVNNWDSVNNQVLTYDLNAVFRNNIFWGENGTVENEVVISRRGSNPFNVLLDHNIYKVSADPTDASLNNNLKNEDPQFDSIDVSKRFYDFHIGLKNSPAVNWGIFAGVIFDLDGKPRDSQPDLGSYEKQ
jgi:hypothetical protein